MEVEEIHLSKHGTIGTYGDVTGETVIRHRRAMLCALFIMDCILNHLLQFGSYLVHKVGFDEICATQMVRV